MYKCSVCGRYHQREEMAVIDDNGWNCCRNCERAQDWIDDLPMVRWLYGGTDDE